MFNFNSTVYNRLFCDWCTSCLFVQLSASSTALALATSEHQRQLHATNVKVASMVASKEHDEIKERLVKAEQRAAELERTLTERTAETNQLIAGLQSFILFLNNN